MQPDKVFKRYDVRGKYPEELDKEFFERMGKALGQFILNNDGSKVVVCRDNKESSIGLKESLIEGITSTGINVIDIGDGPTDYAAFHGFKEECVSVQVTSSHMPLNFNGLKFMYRKGNGFLNEDLNELKRLFKENSFSEGQRRVREKDSSREDYIESAVSFVKENGENFDRKVVIDTSGGATSNFLAEILERLGFDVLVIGKDREGIYRDPPKPDPEELEELGDVVEEENAYLGIATDLDGDRVKLFFDGEWVSGDDLFCLFAQLIEGEVVSSIDTTKKIEKFAEKVHYTRVGDPFVVDRMLKEEASLSGEPNGHYCFSDFVNYNSGIISGALAASVDLGQLMKNIPESFYSKENIEYEDMNVRDEAMSEFRKKAASELDIDSTVDGVKFSYDEASILVRPSGSSPVIRVKSEGGSEEVAERGLDKALEVLGKE